MVGPYGLPTASAGWQEQRGGKQLSHHCSGLPGLPRVKCQLRHLLAACFSKLLNLFVPRFPPLNYKVITLLEDGRSSRNRCYPQGHRPVPRTLKAPTSGAALTLVTAVVITTDPLGPDTEAHLRLQLPLCSPHRSLPGLLWRACAGSRPPAHLKVMA